MAKITFLRLLKEGIANGELNGVATQTKWFNVELAVMNGAMMTTAKVNFWEKEVSERILRTLKEGDLFGEGDIEVPFIPQGYEINGVVQYTKTVFIPKGKTLLGVLAKQGITLKAAVGEEVED